MVIVSKISFDSLLSLGFITREQAMEVYRGIKSKPKESEEDYLRRTYDQAKNIIYKNKIDNLIKQEEEERDRITTATTFLIDYNKVKEQLKKSETQLETVNKELQKKKIDHDWLEIKCKNINEENNKINNMLRILQVENDELRCANRDLYRTNVELLNEPRNGKSITPHKRNAILGLPTKKVGSPHECSICSESIHKKETVLDICHRFHQKCILLWLYESNNCPCCRQKII